MREQAVANEAGCLVEGHFTFVGIAHQQREEDLCVRIVRRDLDRVDGDLPKAQALAKEALGGGRAKLVLAFSPPGEGISAWPFPQMAEPGML